MFLSCVQANTEYISKYQKYQIYQIYRILSEKKNNKQNRINANENEIRIPAHLYALSHMSYTQYSLPNQHEHETTKNETLQSNGRTAREGVPTHTHTYIYHTLTHTPTHLQWPSRVALSLSLSFSEWHTFHVATNPSPTLSLALALLLSLFLSHTNKLSPPPYWTFSCSLPKILLIKNAKKIQTKEQRKKPLNTNEKLSKKNQ